MNKVKKVFSWHRKKVFKPFKRMYNLNGYQMSWIAFGKGFIIGAILL
jgi:hypothetical protein|tara:strand:+ start:19 stop:159 length:141 start_codon:yes stop_codon:yes gene_type:complete